MQLLTRKWDAVHYSRFRGTGFYFFYGTKRLYAPNGSEMYDSVQQRSFEMVIAENYKNVVVQKVYVEAPGDESAGIPPATIEIAFCNGYFIEGPNDGRVFLSEMRNIGLRLYGEENCFVYVYDENGNEIWL